MEQFRTRNNIFSLYKLSFPKKNVRKHTDPDYQHNFCMQKLIGLWLGN